jgi:hypothetical protein
MMSITISLSEDTARTQLDLAQVDGHGKGPLVGPAELHDSKTNRDLEKVEEELIAPDKKTLQADTMTPNIVNHSPTVEALLYNGHVSPQDVADYMCLIRVSGSIYNPVSPLFLSLAHYMILRSYIQCIWTRMVFDYYSLLSLHIQSTNSEFPIITSKTVLSCLEKEAPNVSFKPSPLHICSVLEHLNERGLINTLPFKLSEDKSSYPMVLHPTLSGSSRNFSPFPLIFRPNLDSSMFCMPRKASKTLKRRLKSRSRNRKQSKGSAREYLSDSSDYMYSKSESSTYLESLKDKLHVSDEPLRVSSKRKRPMKSKSNVNFQEITSALKDLDESSGFTLNSLTRSKNLLRPQEKLIAKPGNTDINQPYVLVDNQYSVSTPRNTMSSTIEFDSMSTLQEESPSPANTGPESIEQEAISKPQNSDDRVLKTDIKACENGSTLMPSNELFNLNQNEPFVYGEESIKSDT